MKNLLFLLIFLVGCKTVEVITPPTQDFVFIPPNTITELHLKPVQFQAWNQSQLSEESTKPSNRDVVYYVLDQENLSNLLDNLTDTSDWASKAAKTLNYYKVSIEDYQKSVNENTPKK